MGSAERPNSKALITKYRRHDKDSGSPEVQIALLTDRIGTLSKHFTTNDKDEHSRRGLFAMVSRRKKLLNYLKREDIERYRKTISDLGLRK
ncbi:MAG: 30S ribosomal protein S15 [Oligoflexia bacterium]|nr:30S ribosomal protein S15 [Oligoflexia bacterium]